MKAVKLDYINLFFLMFSDTQKNPSFLCIKIFLNCLNFQKTPQRDPTIIRILDFFFLENVFFNYY